MFRSVVLTISILLLVSNHEDLFIDANVEEVPSPGSQKASSGRELREFDQLMRDSIGGDVSQNITDVKPNFSNITCENIDPRYARCEFDNQCVYGAMSEAICRVPDDIACLGDHEFNVKFQCLYCWQLPESSYDCALKDICKANKRYLTSCAVKQTTYCLGNRQFSRYMLCNIKSGYKWSITMIISLLFGGFGVDRFYLGYWPTGMGKLFSFGGFGVWTLIDALLISIGYLKPANGSHYD